jgi:hypothetical protein
MGLMHQGCDLYPARHVGEGWVVAHDRHITFHRVEYQGVARLTPACDSRAIPGSMDKQCGRACREVASPCRGSMLHNP